MKKIFGVAFLLSLMSMSATVEVAYANNPEKVPGDSINISALGVPMKAAELQLNANGYFVSQSGKLYGHNPADVDASRPIQSDTKYFNYLFNVHDYVPLLDDELIADIELSQNSRFVITASGKVLAAGYNGFGQLGVATPIQIEKLTDVTSSFPNLGSSKIIKIAHNGPSTFALTDDGRLFAYGTQFMIGNNTAFSFASNTTPIEITNFVVGYDRSVDPIVTISHGAALTEAGVLYAWGNYFNTNQVPTSVFDNALLNNEDYLVNVLTMGNGMLVLSDAGRVFGIGSNQNFSIGFDNASSSLATFTELTIPNLTNEDKIVYMGPGFLVSDLGRVYSWGDNRNGKAATGQTNSSTIALTDVTDNVSTFLAEGERFVYGYNAMNPNDGSASALITNLGQVVAFGSRGAFGYPNDGFNAPFTEGINANPAKVTFTINSLGGPSFGPFYWPKSYRLYYNNMLPNPFNSMASLLQVPNYTFGGYYTDEALTNPLPTFDLVYAEEDTTIYVKWIATASSSSQAPNSSLPISNSIPGSSQIPGRPTNLGGPIVLGLATASVGGGAYYWFGIQKKTFEDLFQWFFILIGKKKKKEDKKENKSKKSSKPKSK